MIYTISFEANDYDLFCLVDLFRIIRKIRMQEMVIFCKLLSVINYRGFVPYHRVIQSSALSVEKTWNIQYGQSYPVPLFQIYVSRSKMKTKGKTGSFCVMFTSFSNTSHATYLNISALIIRTSGCTDRWPEAPRDITKSITAINISNRSVGHFQ